MPSAINTFKPAKKLDIKNTYCTGRDFHTGIFMYFLYQNTTTEDVIIRFRNPSMVSDFNSEQLTRLAMESSETSLAKYWDKEEEDYWESYL